jgi:hypothetical protein
MNREESRMSLSVIHIRVDERLPADYLTQGGRQVN